ncbi:hypothetical protein CH362_08445 [Leptospira saintgironsiae]|uniref:Uncharacterized protein n=1 Tax=Leptospira saintgironsiae TaxID=2023183 RepID=A0A2M9YCS7_9LEPT|nr:hypothetical protein CH362_08445 [Leptospira saintgironsiae]
MEFKIGSKSVFLHLAGLISDAYLERKGKPFAQSTIFMICNNQKKKKDPGLCPNPHTKKEYNL